MVKNSLKLFHNCNFKKGIILLIALVICFILYKNIFTTFSQVIWFTSISPSNDNVIKVVENGDTFTFGSQKLIVYLNGTKLFETTLSNDGKSLDENNYIINWMEEYAILVFKGEEQKDEIITVHFNNVNPTYHIMNKSLETMDYIKINNSEDIIKLKLIKEIEPTIWKGSYDGVLFFKDGSSISVKISSYGRFFTIKGYETPLFSKAVLYEYVSK